ncbi:MAG: LPS-assembly protein LptD [Legionella sp.]
MIRTRKSNYCISAIFVIVWVALVNGYSYGASYSLETVEACVIARDRPLSDKVRHKISKCLFWVDNVQDSMCSGSYQQPAITVLAEHDGIHVAADEAFLTSKYRSSLRGHVKIRQTDRVIDAKTAYIYLNSKTNKIKRIELVDNVYYMEPNKLMVAQRAIINPEDKSGRIENVLYRFNTNRYRSILPSWGRASFVERYANKNYLLHKATYSHCPPKDKGWQIDAEEISLDDESKTGVAKHAILRFYDWPFFYAPYLTFPTSGSRKSGFLLPSVGYSNVGGIDWTWPYYWNIAPNYDATITPHVYTRRGMMISNNFRFLTEKSKGALSGSFLAHDKAFARFIAENRERFPVLLNNKTDRWDLWFRDATQISPQLNFTLNYQQVSDSYYLQDFSSNVAMLTQNQLLRQADVTYSNEHWFLKAMLQGFQTLHPINQASIDDVYRRLPQLFAHAVYSQLPLHASINLLSEFDYFRWPTVGDKRPEGARYHLNPQLSFPQIRSWGFITPEIQMVSDHYALNAMDNRLSRAVNRNIPRYSVDSGLYFERQTSIWDKKITQTLEPRLYYLNVPFYEQSQIPLFDSGSMIFNFGQLFRNNRFSGLDRVADTHQLSYAVTSRWLSSHSGHQIGSLSVGQIYYFSNRRLQLCHSEYSPCQDSPQMLGYLSSSTKLSPIAARAIYQLNSTWFSSGDYVWDFNTRSANNAQLNLHYQPLEKRHINIGYSYLINADMQYSSRSTYKKDALHQITVSYAWPLTEKWGTLGVYSHNISKGYAMMTVMGLQYDSCCWAVRLIGGRMFRNINATALSPQYSNSLYLQVILKGLGSIANSDPSTIIGTYFPGYHDIFRH